VTVLLYDHLLSLSDEIEYVWKGKKGPLVYLFFVNRYVTPLGFMINLLAFSILLTFVVNRIMFTIYSI